MGKKAYIIRNLRAMGPGAVVALVLYAATLPLRRRRLKRLKLISDPWREVVLALFWAYCGAMAMILLLPSDFDLLTVLREGYAGRFFRQGVVNMEVFRTFKFSKLVLVANVVLFLPLGFCPALLWRRRSWWGAVILAAAVPIAVENWQVLIGRYFDIDDLLLNALGILLGRVLWCFFGKPRLHCEEQ